MVEDDELNRWFCHVVLPHEPVLMRFIHRNWPAGADIVDIRQDVYERVLTAAQHHGLPSQPRAYLLTTARNLMINRARRAKIVSFDLISDLESADWEDLTVEPHRHLAAREDLRRAHDGLERLPPRCREVVRLRKLEGLSTRDVAERLRVSHHTVERQLTLGMRALTDFMLGGEGRIERGAPARRKTRETQG
ncbi:MAG: sigma-70 family RNA polymerase sigma factor [Brevundimonas sp.]|nr:sigma-70 family RNA polymerase sigma factor [Brevundimonas sp.]